MTDADIIIRFNCGKKNKEYAKELLEILWERKILKSDRVNVLFQQLHNYNGIDDKETYYDNKEYFSILAELIRLLISYGKKIYRFGPIYNACQLYLNNSYVISPDLEIESCTSNEKSIGKISQNGDIIYNDNYKYKSQYMIPDEKCKECRLLPLCMGGCPYKRSKNLNSCLTDLEGIEKYILACKEGIENGCEMA